MDAIHRLFCPRSVAIIGASSDPEKLTGRPIAYLKKHGFSGTIFPVNPRYSEIAGLTCYPDLRALPWAPDVGLVLLGAEQAAAAVKALAEAGAAAAIVLASGFGESGTEGVERQEELKRAAGSMRLLGPNTIGLVNVTEKIMLSASGALELEEFSAGGIAVVSQSGGILGSLLSRGVARGIGFSKLIASGNEADLEVSELVEYLLEDDATSVIALYLEGLRKPVRLRIAAEKAAVIGKPIIAFKVGRSDLGIRSAASHTGAMGGSDRIYDAFFKQVGIIRASTFADLLDIPAALAPKRKLRGNRIAIVTSTGGAATLVADSAGMAGFDTPPPDKATAERLLALNIRDAVLDRNPIDVTLAGLRSDLFRAAIDALFASPTYDAVIVVVGSSGIGRPNLVAQPVIDVAATSDKPLLIYVSPEAPQIVRHFNSKGVPAFAAPESCAAALSALLQQSIQARASSTGARSPPRVTVAGDLGLQSGPLNEAESKQIFARFGIPAIRELVAREPDGAEKAAHQFGGNVVVKILSRHITHKTELGGVAVNIRPDDVARRCEEMRTAVHRLSKHPIEGFLVQELIEGGTEMILGCHIDPQLGPAILLGAGGIAAEIFKDTAIRLPPIDRRNAQVMIDELKSATLLTGFRGQPRGDIDGLISAILAFSDMVVGLGERLIEAEINPLFVLPEGQGVRTADALVVLR